MLVRTFGAYVLMRFARTVLLVFFGILTLIFLIDFIDAIGTLAREEEFTWLTAMQVSLLRSFFVQDDILPFAFLWGAIIGLIALSRRSELIIARASGISIWGLLAMPILFALALGFVSVLVLNPLAVRLKQDADVIEKDIRNRSVFRERDIWIRQTGRDASSIIHANSVSANATVLHGVTAFLFDEAANRFLHKIEAERADYTDGAWVLRNAAVTSDSAEQETFNVYLLPTNQTAEEVRRLLTQPDTLSLWGLNKFIAAAQESGLKTERFRYSLHELLARPFFLSAMVLLAATVSLRVVRASRMGPRVLAGIIGGFLLYVVVEFLRDLAGNGIIDPALAAWAPSIVALTMGTTVLLFQEDG